MTLACFPTRRQQWTDRTALVWLGGPMAAVTALATSQLTGPTLCPTRLCTGHACPGCGLTRAIGAAARGDFGLSFRFHPLALVLMTQLVVAWGLVAAGLWSPTWQRRLPALLVANAVTLVAVWIVRWRLGLLHFVLDE